MLELRRRVVVSFTGVLVVLAFGTVGYSALGGDRWTLSECAFMTLETVTTLGLDALPGFDDVRFAREFTMLLLVLGIGTFLYFASSFTAYIFESDLQNVFKERHMLKEIAALSGHVIVCGSGETGGHVIRELRATGTQFVAIDTNEERLRKLEEEATHKKPLLKLVGDATEDRVLSEAGIARAKALVAALPDDKDNLYVVVTARQANPVLRIVAKGIGTRAADKLRKAGADAVVSTNQIGGLRMASEVVRPHVVEFLDEMLRERDKALRIEEVEIDERSPLAGKTLREARIRDHANALVLAVRDSARRTFLYNPGPDHVLTTGTTLIVLGPIAQMASLKDDISGPSGNPGS